MAGEYFVLVCSVCEKEFNTKDPRRILKFKHGKHINCYGIGCRARTKKMEDEFREQWKHRPSLKGEKGVKRRTLKDYEEE